MNRTLIQEYTSLKVKMLINEAKGIQNLDHKPTKGKYRELFVKQLLKPLLPGNLGIGSGVVMNRWGEQSNETDIVIYDRSFIPPMIEEESIGTYPVEGVLATIEIKSWIDSSAIKSAEKSAKKLIDEICKSKDRTKVNNTIPEPVCGIIGFDSKSLKALKDESDGRKWLNDNKIIQIKALCLIDGYSWIQMDRQGKPYWVPKMVDANNEETKRFIAVLLDNIRTISFQRSSILKGVTTTHNDLIGAYLRDQ